MAISEDKESVFRKLGIPAAVGAIGAGAGLLLTRKKQPKGSETNRKQTGIGDLTDDLRRKVSSLGGKNDSSRQKSSSDARPASDFDADEYSDRRREREERRKSRKRAKA